jgi:glutaredoxin
MPARSLLALSLVAACAVFAASASAELYRYVDPSGRVVYSDHPPPASAKGVESRALTDNVIETDPLPIAAQEAAKNFPVTLYTFDCQVCKDAQALLAKRGIPFETVIVTEEKGAARLKALTGKQVGPVLQVGEKQVLEGYNAERWQAALDDAGYPRTVPNLKREPARTATAAKPKVEEIPPPPKPGTGYPVY